MLKILGKSPSINVRKVLWTCRELALPFEQEQWGMGYQSTATPEFLKLNPVGLVPVLIDGDLVLTESNTIIRYLAGAYDGKTLFPHAPRERARIEQWMDWQATELNNAWRYVFMGLIRNDPNCQDPLLRYEGITIWSRMMGILDAQLKKTGAYIAGETFSLADIVIGLSVQRWYSTPFARPELDAVQQYYQRLSLRTGFQEFGCNGMP